jgi:hypothetical protein
LEKGGSWDTAERENKPTSRRVVTKGLIEGQKEEFGKLC